MTHFLENKLSLIQRSNLTFTGNNLNPYKKTIFYLNRKIDLIVDSNSLSTILYSIPTRDQNS
jgi:hypothetical protein